MLATLFGSVTYGVYIAASVLISTCVLFELLLLRFAQSEYLVKGILTLKTEHGRNVSLAMSYEDCRDAKHFLWQSRIDVKKLAVLPSNL
jgi:hypothetical protein